MLLQNYFRGNAATKLFDLHAFDKEPKHFEQLHLSNSTFSQVPSSAFEVSTVEFYHHVAQVYSSHMLVIFFDNIWPLNINSLLVCHTPTLALVFWFSTAVRQNEMHWFAIVPFHHGDMLILFPFAVKTATTLTLQLIVRCLSATLQSVWPDCSH